MAEDEQDLSKGAVNFVEEQIRRHARAREIFSVLQGLHRDPHTECEVSVIGSVKPTTGFSLRQEELVGRGFLVFAEGSVLTTENSRPGSKSEKALAFAHVFSRSVDEASGAVENGLSKFGHVITTNTTDGLQPQVGDILVERKVGGFFGYPERVRLIKPNMSNTQVKVAIDFITS